MKFKFSIITSLVVLLMVNCNTPASKNAPTGNDALMKGKENSVSDTLTKKVVNLDQNQLVGNWVRNDGGYELEIKSTTSNGLLDAAYFNPNPIHVGRAEWHSKDKSLIIIIELQDKNYPGSTYTLQYLEREDRLVGNYFQAVEGSNYDVEFVRIK